ncbi:MAG TPA: response regulator [Verrucomicrobiae bacterium]|nr:response regulator [Verrucomicrobiae bacterium]
MNSTRTASVIPSGRTYEPEISTTRIWVVDDNAGLRELLVSLLNGEDGFECERQFPSPTAVLNALATEPAPDIILLDIQMGAENGLDAIRPIKALAKNTHVLMLTTFGPPDTRQRAFREGASDFLMKSWSFDEIARHIRRAMEFGPVAGLLTAFLERQVPAEKPMEAPQIRSEPKSSGADRWFNYLRGWLKFSPS